MERLTIHSVPAMIPGCGTDPRKWWWLRRCAARYLKQNPGPRKLSELSRVERALVKIRQEEWQERNTPRSLEYIVPLNEEEWEAFYEFFYEGQGRRYVGAQARHAPPGVGEPPQHLHRLGRES